MADLGRLLWLGGGQQLAASQKHLGPPRREDRIAQQRTVPKRSMRYAVLKRHRPAGSAGSENGNK
jgi:hypothetical protein